MISFERSYKTSDGKFHATLEEAQAEELQILICQNSDLASTQLETARFIARLLAKNREAVLNILTTTDTSRPKARKANGATRKPRTPKATTEPASA